MHNINKSEILGYLIASPNQLHIVLEDKVILIDLTCTIDNQSFINTLDMINYLDQE